MNIFIFILTNNIIPIFTLVALGFLLSKKFNLDINTISKMIFYIIAPCFVFVNIYKTEIHIDMMKIVLICAIVLLCNFFIASLISKIRHYNIGMKNAFANSIMFFNSANIGIPLITLVFSNEPFVINGETPYLTTAIAAQIMVMLFQNITINSIGFINASRANTQWKDSLAKVFKMPIIYTMILAFIFKFSNYDITKFPLWASLNYGANALVALNLIALGVQLAKTRFSFSNIDVYLSCFIRLVIGPLLAITLVFLFQLKGIVAQVAMISSALPTAVNTALIAVEYDNHPDFASQIVMISTLLSAISLAFVIYFARVLFPVL